jgi:hypothetical protein
MWDDPALFHARRVRALYPLSDQATLPELLDLCADRCLPVLRGDFQTPGFFFYCPDHGPVIFLAHRASAEVLAHEVFHYLTADNILTGVVYSYFDEGCSVEKAARDFACLLTGTEEEQRARGLR